MKRSLLFGASFSLILTGIGIAYLGHVLPPPWGSTVTGIVAVLVGGLAYTKGRTAQPAGWLITILAWIFGLFASGLFYAPFFYVALLARGTTQGAHRRDPLQTLRRKRAKPTGSCLSGSR